MLHNLFLLSTASNEIQCHSKKVEGNQNENVFLDCYSGDDNQTPIWTWTTPRNQLDNIRTIAINDADGMLIHNPNRYALKPTHGNNSYPLLILNVVADDAGTYNCSSSVDNRTLACWDLVVAVDGSSTSQAAAPIGNTATYWSFVLLALFLIVLLFVMNYRTRFLVRVFALVVTVLTLTAAAAAVTIVRAAKTQ